MACCGGEAGLFDQKTKEIDRQLYEHQKALRAEVKLVLLGSGESGKSTIFKQLKIIQTRNAGYTEQELRSFRFVVYANVISQMKVLVKASKLLNIPLQDSTNEQIAERIEAANSNDWNNSVGEDISILWRDKGIQETYSYRDRRFQLNDSASYFFDNVQRFCKDNYVPSQMDILCARVRSTGIREAFFEFDEITFRVVDVGGQRSERRKWIHCFDCVTAVLFVASLSEYDQVLREDESQNRVKESLLLFAEICNSPFFEKSSLILFLNKTDLFKEKLERGIDLSICFPSYRHGPDETKALEYMKKKYLQKNRANRDVYTHFTCAVNTKNIAVVFGSIRETLLNKTLDQSFI